MSKYVSKSLFVLMALTALLFGAPGQDADTLISAGSPDARQDTLPAKPTIPEVETGDGPSWFDWIEKHPVLFATLVGLIAAAAAYFAGRFGRRTPRQEAEIAVQVQKAIKEEEEEVQERQTTQAASTLEERYRDYVLDKHGSIKLYGFLSQANIDVRLLDVFVSLRFSENPTLEHRKLLPRHAPKTVPAGEEEPGMEPRQGEPGKLSPREVLERGVSSKRYLLLLGGPGSGKTTLLKYFAVCCLSPQTRRRIGLKKLLIPFFISLRQVDPGLEFVASLAKWAQTNNLELAESDIKRWLRDPGALVLLDGLDEVSDLHKRREICEWIDRSVPAFKASTFIVTCRFSGYYKEGVELKQAHVQADVLDLDLEQQGNFLRQWFRAVRLERLPAAQKKNPRRLEELENAAAASAEEVLKVLSREENRALQAMASVPVLLQIIAIIWEEQQGRLSGERVELYSRCIDYLLEHRDYGRTPPLEPLMSAARARLVLRPLALAMQARWKEDESPREKVEKQIAAKLQAVQPGLEPLAFLENIRDRAGVLVGSGADTYTFQHKSFREYLAALEIANSRRVGLLVRNFGDDWWQEVLLFAAGMSSPEIFPAFIDKFLKHRKNNAPALPLLLQMLREAADKPLAPFAKTLQNREIPWQNRYNALQCLRLLRSKEAEELVLAAQNDLEPSIQQLAKQILIEWGLLQPVVEAAETPARIYNSREENAEYILIPGATEKVVFESTPLRGAPDYPLYFAKYPLTNKLYRRFIDYLAGVGAIRESPLRESPPLRALPPEQFAASLLKKAEGIEGFAKYLGGDPQQWAEKLRSSYDDDKRFNGEDQPVVGVSWFAAAAYCVWLTELELAIGNSQLAIANSNPVFRLPTEEEWEWAAGGGKREYPWGNEAPDETRANYGQKVGQTTPVGAYPAGATPEGLMDMAGNVWEWMENLYGAKDWPGARALRGGAWYHLEDALRCSARGHGVPDVRNSLIGFRVVVAQS